MNYTIIYIIILTPIFDSDFCLKIKNQKVAIYKKIIYFLQFTNSTVRNLELLRSFNNKII